MRRYWVVPFGAAVGLALALVAIGGVDRAVLAWLLAVNAVAFVTTWFDKRFAGTDRTRVPEAVLQGLAVTGGWPLQLLAMRLVHHKTGPQSRRFRIGLWVAVSVNMAVVIVLVLARR